MQYKALLVDDVANVLNSFRRNLHGKIAFDIADSGKSALALMEKSTYAVLLTDMKMPEMDGLVLLKEAKHRYPDTIRIMLTGNAEQQTAVDAVNEGDVFRFLTKPCSVEELIRVIEAGFRQYKLITSEKVLLNNTIRGVVNVLYEVLGLINPHAAAHSVQLKIYMMQLAKEMRLKSSWTFEPMIELSQLGAIIYPSILADKRHGESLSIEEKALIEQHASLAHDLLENIPRFENIARNILYQDKCFNGEGFPDDGVKGTDIPVGSRMLKVVNDFLIAKESGLSTSEAVQRMENHAHRYDRKILSAFSKVLFQKYDSMVIALPQLDVGMVLAEPLVTEQGKVLAATGQIMTASMKEIVELCIQKGAFNTHHGISVFLEEQLSGKGSEDMVS